MQPTTNIIERAYQLARSGRFASPSEIERALSQEQFSSVSAHLGAPTLRKELAKLCRDARASAADDGALVPAG